MALEDTFYIDLYSRRRVQGLNTKNVVTNWESFYGSIRGMKIYLVTPTTNNFQAPYYQLVANDSLEMRVSLGLVPDPSEVNAAFQTAFRITHSDFTKDTVNKCWTGDFDLDNEALGELVAIKNPVSLLLQFDVQENSNWVTVAQIDAAIRDTFYIIN